MTTLFDPITVGALSLTNRIIMSPLTRCRAEAGRVPGELMVEYYRQRASFGMIITEATSVMPMGVGYPNTPGIWSEEQVAGWRKVTEAVHAEGGIILLQLWHVGRISDPLYLDGELPVAPSAVKPAGHVSLVRPIKDYVIPRALETTEIKKVVEAYRQGAENARKAGFDGVEIHGANGYLPDQFLQSSTNLRNDEYGGSLENRVRFPLEVTDAALSIWEPGRVGMHLSPGCDAHDMGDNDPEATFGHLVDELDKRKIAFICSREEMNSDSLGPKLKARFSGSYIANQDLDQEQAKQLLTEKKADAVAFGRKAIANPDLPERFAQNSELNEQDRDTFYGSGPEGYIDYPTLKSSSV